MAKRKDVAAQTTIITKTYLNTDSNLSNYGRKYLIYPNDLLVPATLTQGEDSFTLDFDTGTLRGFDYVDTLPKAEKYRVLANIAVLEKLLKDYSFSLAPSNLVLDVNLIPKLIERDTADLNSNNNFVEQYRALVAHVTLSRYNFEDFLQGGADLYKKSALLKEIATLETAKEISNALTQHSFDLRDKELKKYARVPRKRARILNLAVPVLSVLTIVALALFAWSFIIIQPTNDAIIEANRAYLRQDYVRAQREAASVGLSDMPYEVKYMLARASVMTEALSPEQREVVLASFTMQTDERFFSYWIALGRLDFYTAIDFAKQLSDEDLELYAWSARRLFLEHDTTLSGAEKQEGIAEAEREIERLQTRIEEGLDLLSELDQEIDQGIDDTDGEETGSAE